MFPHYVALTDNIDTGFEVLHTITYHFSSEIIYLDRRGKINIIR